MTRISAKYAEDNQTGDNQTKDKRQNTKTRGRKTGLLIVCALAAALTLCAGLTYAAEPGSSGDPIALKSYVDTQIAALDSKLSALISGNGGTGAGTSTGTGAGTGTDGSVPVDSDSLAVQLKDITEQVAKINSDIATIRSALRRLTGSGGTDADAGVSDEDAGIGGNVTGDGADGTDAGIGDGSGSFTSDAFTVEEFKAGTRVIMGAGTEMIIRTGEALAIRGELGCVLDLITAKDLDAGDSVPQNHLLVSARDDSRGVRIEKDAYVMIKGDYIIR